MFSLDVGLDGDDMVGGERGWLRAPNIGGRDPRCVTDENREPHHASEPALDRLKQLDDCSNLTVCTHNVRKHVYRPHS